MPPAALIKTLSRGLIISLTSAVTTFDIAPPKIKPTAKPTTPCSLIKFINPFIALLYICYNKYGNSSSLAIGEALLDVLPSANVNHKRKGELRKAEFLRIGQVLNKKTNYKPQHEIIVSIF